MEKADQVRLNHELLIWVGFTLSNGVWSYPDGVTVDNGVPFFPEDETACFKWLAPKLDICTRIEFHPTPVKGEREWVADIQVPRWNGQELDYKSFLYCGKTPALALCLAIQKLIRSK